MLKCLFYPARVLLPLLCAALSGCTTVTLAIANAPAVFGEYTVDRDISYGELDAHKLDVYMPQHVPRADAIIVFFHGGGWDSGSKDEYRFVAEALTSRGYTVVVPNYRLYPETQFPGFVDDAALAMTWTQNHAAEIGGEGGRVFIMGHSAGAHIGALLSFDERYLQGSTWINGFIGLAGPYDFLPLTSVTLEQIFAPKERYAESQPINFVDGAEPRTLLLHGLADDLVLPKNSTQLAAAIRHRGGRVEERYYDDMSHSGVLAAMSVYYRGRRQVLDDIDVFIKAELKHTTDLQLAR